MAVEKLGFKRILAITVIVCIAVAFGAGGYFYYTIVLQARKPLVAVITVDGPILRSEDASWYVDMINYALLNDSVKAVVVRINSPGGYADLVEEIYLDLLELKKVKPVAASVTMALSGGYYIAVAADYIYATPTSVVGSVGVIGTAPPMLIPSEFYLESGPYKVTGFSKLLFSFNLSRALESFVSAVETGRGDRLKLSSSELKKGLIYFGAEAVELGLVDEVGSLQKAVRRVAEEAGLVEYEVVDLNKAVERRLSYLWSYHNQTLDWRNLTLDVLNEIQPPPALWYLYLPPKALAQGVPSTEARVENMTAEVFGGGGGGVVLVDRSHGNEVSAWELDVVIGELAKRNITVRFVSGWSELSEGLDNASCLIVACPTIPYTVEECDRIEEFVKAGRLLILIFDPAYEYLLVPELFGPINSLATRFGMAFAKGYLYNEEDYYGLYRNIYVKTFAESPVTRNISTLVMFTATHIYATGGVAWASNGTYSSAAERAGNYTVIALAGRGNGTVIALADLTLFREPYCYVEDNYRVILNLASAIAEVKVIPPAEKPAEAEMYQVTEPELPVGTVKNFTEQVNGEKHLVRWIKVSELEVLVERPNMTTLYHFDENGSLVWWTSDGIEVIYDEPIPKPPYPLVKGKTWSYESGYTLSIQGRESRGKLTGTEKVVGFENVTAEDGTVYLCAKVRYSETNQFTLDGRNITITYEGYSWTSSEAGLVKDECTTRYYENGIPVMTEQRTLILRSIKKGQI
ncbi:S49 family peptidase [Candidatus Bathyarchaeota archaeon]|nr:MAG: S49 family peptidase [Candidatus Bathyarchaeota archaeon]